MKKLITIAGAALLATSVAGAAFGQANPNATQPNSTGTGTYTPNTTATGQAVDTKQTGQSGHATTGSSMNKDKSMNSGKSNGMMKKEN